MSLLTWAEQCLEAQVSPEIVDLHVKDTLAAAQLGLRTSEGRALAQFYAERAQATERAAAVAAIARLSECDDIHLESCVTPGAIVIPTALALSDGHSEDDFNRAVCAGYAAGLSLGIAIGGVKALAHGVWPTLLAAPAMAAATASCLRVHDANKLAHSVALALAGASGRIGRPSGTPSGRWFVLADAIMKGLRASEAAECGFHGDLDLLSEHWLAAQAGHNAIDVDALGSSAHGPSLADVGFKPFPIARQALTAVLAFQALLSKGLDLSKLERLEVLVPSENKALLTRPLAHADRLSRLSNLGFQLACAAHAPKLLDDPERRALPFLVEFGQRVVVLSNDGLGVDGPGRWPAKVTVNAGGERFEEAVARTPFDHDAPGLSDRLNEKWRRLLSLEDADEFLHASKLSGTDRVKALWQILERRVSIAK